MITVNILWERHQKRTMWYDATGKPLDVPVGWRWRLPDFPLTLDLFPDHVEFAGDTTAPGVADQLLLPAYVDDFDYGRGCVIHGCRAYPETKRFRRIMRFLLRASGYDEAVSQRPLQEPPSDAMERVYEALGLAADREWEATFVVPAQDVIEGGLLGRRGQFWTQVTPDEASRLGVARRSLDAPWFDAE